MASPDRAKANSPGRAVLSPKSAATFLAGRLRASCGTTTGQLIIARHVPEFELHCRSCLGVAVLLSRSFVIAWLWPSFALARRVLSARVLHTDLRGYHFASLLNVQATSGDASKLTVI